MWSARAGGGDYAVQEHQDGGHELLQIGENQADIVVAATGRREERVADHAFERASRQPPIGPHVDYRRLNRAVRHTDGLACPLKSGPP